MHFKAPEIYPIPRQGIIMIREISSYYTNVIAPLTIEENLQGAIKTISPLSRMDFLGGSSMAFFFAIQKIALSTLALLANIFTLCMNPKTRAFFLENIHEVPKYLGAIPFGFIGSIIPQMINKNVLHLPSREFLMGFS